MTIIIALASQVLIITKTIYLEAADQPLVGKLAVASVIHWRHQAEPRRSLADTCLRTGFDCWRGFDPGDHITEGEGKVWEECKAIAQSLLDGEFEPTIKANHYLNEKLTLELWGELPGWYYLGTNKTVIGQHAFFWVEGSGK